MQRITRTFNSFPRSEKNVLYFQEKKKKRKIIQGQITGFILNKLESWLLQRREPET